MNIPQPLLEAEASRHPYPLLFATVSGAHLYGFPSPDSDFDLRGVHVLPIAEALGLFPLRDTIEFAGVRDGIELDLVTHDAGKFFRLLLKRNGYVLEQLYSPLIVQTTPAHSELKDIARGCVTRHHSHHYLGFAATQWQLFAKEQPSRVKPLLYTYRVLLTGIYLMRTGIVQANLEILNEEFRLPYIAELIERKRSGTEKGTLDSSRSEFYAAEYARLVGELQESEMRSQLPDEPSARPALHDLLIRLRLASPAS